MKINFKYSYQFDCALGNKVFPKHVPVHQMSEFWLVNSINIKEAFLMVTGLLFCQESLNCYLNSSKTFSDPLSIKIESLDDMKDNLIHELTHVLLTQNYDLIKKEWDQFFNETYSNYSFSTKSHIAVHAIHLEVCKLLFPNRVEHVINYSKDVDYRKSWDIVLDNPKKILAQLFPKEYLNFEK